MNRAQEDLEHGTGDPHIVVEVGTQEELADLVGLSRASIANLEGGRQRIPLHHLFAIAQALGTEVPDLIPGCEALTSWADESVISDQLKVVADGRELRTTERDVIARVLLSHDRPAL